MNRLTVFLMGIVVGAGGLYASENYYIVQSSESFHLIPKVAAKLEFPYRDIRAYTVEDWRSDPSLALAVFRSKRENLMLESGLSGMRQQFEGLLRSIGGQ